MNAEPTSLDEAVIFELRQEIVGLNFVIAQQTTEVKELRRRISVLSDKIARLTDHGR